MHGRIPVLVLLALALAPAAHAHVVQLKEAHASYPSAAWDPDTHSWTLGLAAKVECDGATRIDGALSARPKDGGPPGVFAMIERSPDLVMRETVTGLQPGDHELVFEALACTSYDEADGEGHEHVGSIENVVTQEFRLLDCDDPRAVLTTRSTLRPLIPVDQDVPPNAQIRCPPPPPPPPCRAARRRALFPAPLVPVAGGVQVKPCKSSSAPEAPAADVKCGGSGARAAARVPNPLIPIGPSQPPQAPPPPPLPKSTDKNCWGEIELQAESVVRKRCQRSVSPAPLVPVECEPDAAIPAQAYAARVRRIAAYRFRIRRGTSELLKVKLSKKQRKAAEAGAVRFTLRVRDRNGRIVRSRSVLYTL